MILPDHIIEAQAVAFLASGEDVTFEQFLRIRLGDSDDREPRSDLAARARAAADRLGERPRKKVMPPCELTAAQLVFEPARGAHTAPGRALDGIN